VSELEAFLDQPDDKTSLVDLKDFHDQIEQRLDFILREEHGLRIESAMRTCVFSGGKRLRPKLVMVTARTLGADPARALDLACAVEMVHGASLILDDLPCMDNAAERRGAPACHLTFGEDIAILAAVTLITRAFQVVTDAPHIADSTKVEICSLLSDALGVKGLAAGQESDLRDMQPSADMDAVTEMEHNKTGILFEVCLQAAGLVAEATKERIQALKKFGYHLGLAFQIFDDLLDALGSREKTGKDHNQDSGRSTFATVMSSSDAEAHAFAQLQSSLAVLESAGIHSRPLMTLVKVVFSQYKQQIA